VYIRQQYSLFTPLDLGKIYLTRQLRVCVAVRVTRSQSHSRQYYSCQHAAYDYEHIKRTEAYSTAFMMAIHTTFVIISLCV